VDELSFRCGQMSVRREAANVLPIIAGIRDSAVQLVSVLGSVVRRKGREEHTNEAANGLHVHHLDLRERRLVRLRRLVLSQPARHLRRCKSCES
jgi:hypothetical protein